MKKIIFAFAMMLVCQFSFAQDAFKNDTKRYMDLSGQMKTFEMLTKEIVANVEETKRPDFEKELKASMVVLVDKMAEMYMTEFTHDDVKKLIAFYESPIGKKLSDKSEILFEKGQKVGEEWSVGLQGLMMKYMQQ
ncbi:DUF2059 domain-containing protein [Myroides sp. M-43]|uniref:DUF2059 domain-containing protein n=1 Tax=Myroides oncorhynchi TaxID=2893756 RepID=UPI001E31EBD2|nr:DUF2059 domain-containing protein [Myroides oncorhynchi]MCC9042814.1 DUF2059 domain-containing protein [Myroides oncorhynchi]